MRYLRAVMPSGPCFLRLLIESGIKARCATADFLLSRPGEMSERYYFFSINREMVGNSPWRSGSVYILPRDSFNQSGTGIVRFDEWFSEEPVIPVAKFDISPRDFPLFERVGAHNEGEPVYLTWIKYKKRLKQQKMEIFSKGITLGSGGGIDTSWSLAQENVQQAGTI